MLGKMYIIPAENLPSPRGLASGKSYANFSSEFEFLDLKTYILIYNKMYIGK